MHLRAWMVFPLLGACASAVSYDDGVVSFDASDVLPADEAAPPLAAGYLELGVNAFDQGESVQLKARGANAGDTVVFLRGSAYGAGGCPAQISPLCLQILGPVQVLGTAVANAQGVATHSFVMPNAGLNQDLAVQAVVQSPSAKSSEAWERTVRPNGATQPYALGANYQQASSASVSANAILAHTIEITESVTVAGFSCRFNTGGGRFKSALYADGNGAPGQLVAQSRPTAITAGVTQAPNTAPAAQLAPGRYWQATTFEAGADTWSNGLAFNNPEWIILQPFGSAFPANWVGGNFYQSPRIDCAVVVQ